MALTFTNLATHMLILQLNNGNSVYLAPGETSAAIHDGQVNGNDKIAKLQRNNFLATSQAKEPAKPKKAEAREPVKPKKAEAGKEAPA
jgi:hypothetical protein